MDGDLPADYLAGLPESQRDELARVNKPGLAALREYLASGEAVAFLGALRAHAMLDQPQGPDHQWAARADALNAQLVPPGLDPDPLTTVERHVAAEKAAAGERNAAVHGGSKNEEGRRDI